MDTVDETPQTPEQPSGTPSTAAQTAPDSPKPRRDKQWLLPLVAGIALAAGTAIGWFLHPRYEPDARYEKLDELLALIEENYVDTVNIDSLLEHTYTPLLANLDPHSVYISAADRTRADDELSGSFSGIGVQFQLLDDTITIVEVISGGPSEKVGLMAGDRIVTVDGNPVPPGIQQDEVLRLLRGTAGSQVNLGIVRRGAGRPLSFTVTRGEVPVKSIDAAFMAGGNTGYVRVNRFARNTYGEFLNAMVGLAANGATDFIIDLRGNVGGYMEPAVLMANEFLPEGSTIVSTRGRSATMPGETVLSDGNATFADAGLVILIDEYTASASEIFAGAIQDNDRGLVVGRRSFGKGLVQKPFDLSDGSEVRLTVQRYYTPSGRSIQKDYVPGQNDAYEYEIFDRYRNGELNGKEAAGIDRSKIYTTAGGRQVYGGGGIMPDLYVAADTTGITTYYANVVNAGLLQKFAIEYVDLNRSQLTKAKDLKALLKQLPADDILLGSFADYARMNGIAPRWYYINISGKLIVTQLKALIARDILGTSAYWQTIADIDPNMSQALRLVKVPPLKFTE